LKNVASLSYSFIGNLDADVSFDEFYYENIIKKFNENEKLGIAGGFIYEEYHGKFKSRPTNTIRSVAGAIQFFSRECFEATGGYIPLESGGEDWVMEINAKMRGWQIKSFRDLIVFHHKKSGNNLSQVIKRRFNEGCMDFSVGSHPIFEVIKCTQRFNQKPYLIGGIIRLFGFYSSYLLKKNRIVSDDFIAFLRREQMNRLLSMFIIR
jgi:GT2 family glycosyltransferase